MSEKKTATPTVATATVKTATETIEGREFKLQHPGTRWYTRHADESRTRQGLLSQEKYIEGLIENVVVDPVGLTLDDLSIREAEELVTRIERFLRS